MSSQPKMHRCLKVPELLSAICAFLEDYELLQLSLTCRDFCSYALDALWSSTREGLAALIRCFPDDVIEEINDGNRESWARRVRLSVRRIPKAEEWDRIRLYASRMRVLHISDTGFLSGKPTDECYRLFLGHWPYPDHPIFPNLRGATLCPATFRTGSLILAAVGQTLPLRELRIRFDGWTPKHDSDVEEIDKALLACRHSATSLALNFESVQPTLVMGIADRISSALCRFSSLREADLCQSFPLSSEALSHLALLPDLTKLSFMYTKDYANPQLLAPHPDNFRNLKTLELRISETTGLDEACVLLENLHCTRLETLSIWFNSEPLAARLFDLARSIARFTSLRKLELMSMALEGLLEWQPADPDDWPIQCSAMLSTLSPLRNLHTLMISYLPLHVTPDDIRNVARFWPEIRTLELSASDEFTTTTVRAADLHPLVTGCPQLHEIMLPIVGDADDAEEEEDGAVGEQPEHRGVKIVTVCLRGCAPRRPTPRDKAPLRRMFPQARIEVAAVRVRDGESYGGGAYGGVDYDDFDDDDYGEEDEDGLVESTEGNESDDWY